MSRRKVLLVDDSPIVRAVAAHALAAGGLEVTSIDHPEALAAEIARDTPDLLLVDAGYPKMTDDRLVEIVKSFSAAYPVVLFSDRSQGEVDALVARMGARGAVPKEGATLVANLRPFLDA